MGGERRFFEFFAGGGMVRAGLETAGPQGRWRCVFANDVDPAKVAAYRANWGAAELRPGDVAEIAPEETPGRPDLVWASFPCQDLSLAGAGSGLSGARSGAFWPFWRLMERLRAEGRGPRLIALENVCGLLTAHGGRDFAALVAALAAAELTVGGYVIDAAAFLPQSRPRLFLIAASAAAEDPALWGDGPPPAFSPEALIRAVEGLPPDARAAWRWRRLDEPPAQNAALIDILEPDGPELAWRSEAETAALLALMAPLHRSRVEAMRRSGERTVGAVFRRTRRGASGERLQRAEIRVDGLAGCLRTPAGGSSRQLLLEIEGERTRSRLLTPRETARLMGLPDSYRLPARATAAYHLTGDGVAAPAARWLAERLFEPMLAAADRAEAARAAAE